MSDPTEDLKPVWRDIESAPKDGTRVILAVTGGMVVGHWVRHRAYAHCWAWMVLPWPDCDFLMAVEPTHWLPLPQPPGDAA